MNEEIFDEIRKSLTIQLIKKIKGGITITLDNDRLRIMVLYDKFGECFKFDWTDTQDFWDWVLTAKPVSQKAEIFLSKYRKFIDNRTEKRYFKSLE